MNTSRVNALVRELADDISRRRFTGAFATVLSIAAFPWSETDAKKRKRRKKRKKVKFNSFGCVNGGNFCKNGEQCCSGICEGKKCKAHDQSTCQVGQTDNSCGGVADVPCTLTDGGEGFCLTTTGNAGYCGDAGDCFPCTKDADCVAVCGQGAACVPCVESCPDEGTACFGLAFDSCSI